MMSFRHCFDAIMLMMIALLLLVCGTTTVNGFQSPRMVVQHQETSSTRRMTVVLGSEVTSRQAFLVNSATAAAAVAIGAGSALVILPPAPAQADEYDDARAAKRAQDAESKGASTLAVPLIGGLLLSLPFFLPNILRLLGVKNSKMKD
jgi:vancomycin permeability regulator SanA